MRNNPSSSASIERVKARQRRLLAEGRCRICGAPNDRAPKTLCAECADRNNTSTRKWREAHKRDGRCLTCGVFADGKRRCAACKLAAGLARHAKYVCLRHVAIEHYGGQCACCGEDNSEFLTFDHIDGGGTLHRRIDSLANANMGQWLKNAGYPDYIRLLCANCNQATKRGQTCPHQLMKGTPCDAVIICSTRA
jgi:hypothetical protein